MTADERVATICMEIPHGGYYADRVKLRKDIAGAIRAAEADALERAASEAETHLEFPACDCSKCVNDLSSDHLPADVARGVTEIAAAIRNLKESP